VIHVGRQHFAIDKSFCMHRFAGPIRVIELLAMFDETHPSINDAGSRQSFKVQSFSLLSVYTWSVFSIATQHSEPSDCIHDLHGLFVTGAIYIFVMPGFLKYV